MESKNGALKNGMNGMLNYSVTQPYLMAKSSKSARMRLGCNSESVSRKGKGSLRKTLHHFLSWKARVTFLLCDRTSGSIPLHCLPDI
jgi:hypothetical protein